MKKFLAICAAASLSGCAGTMPGEPLQVVAPGPQGDLAGTLIAPASGKPTVIIIPGSGPTDRDGNNPMGVTASSYRLLSEGLAESGIGSLRIDKRGMFQSAAAVSDPNAVTVTDYVKDVRGWADLARNRTGADCVWLLGHSEGGLIALEAAQSPEGICGVLLVASVGRPLGDTIREQLRSNPANAPILGPAMAALDKLEAGERVSIEGMHPALLSLFSPSVQGYLIDVLKRDPAQLAGKINLPILVVAGGKDIQTPVADAQALKVGQPDAEVIEIDDMNHVLKAVAGEGRAANLATYSNADLPIHPELVTAIVRFVKNSAD